MKTKYKILTFSLIFAFALGLSSCSEDFLQTVPTDSVSTEIALGTTDNMMLALNGVHRAMYAQNGRISNYAGEQFMIPTAEYGASDALHSTTGNGWHRARLQWNMHTNATRTDVSFVWYHYYNVIGSVNNIINAAEELQPSDELDNVLGQAYTYRAWAHFNLVRYFGKAYMIGNPSSDLGVPIMLATEPPYEGLERNTVQQVYDQIITDLTTAFSHFEGATSRNDLSHLNIDVARGIAARVYLTIGDWPNAASYANAARQDYPLMSESEYKSGFNSISNPEWMWGSKMIQDQTSYYYSYFYYCSNNFNGSQNRSNPKFMNHNLYNQMSETDYRRDLILADCPSTFDDWDSGENAGRYASEEEYDEAVAEYRDIVDNSSRHNMVPYLHIKLQQADGPTISPMDVLHMRAAEMYLIEAEALAHDNSSAAADVLFELVSARDADYEKSTNTGQALIDEILLQRRFELFLEGHRWFDMLRNDEELDLTGSGANPDLYLDGYKQDRPSVNDDWMFRIPQRELDANPNMAQND
ncbi:RagB/SusD family nutrient uptake outer membrane protein [Draconibacterium halophilum]|uniref:RagB/SusD family nutrient uptake outer membrane protein n=1 Tax=Draconibacterium halophilum TaxID=2706887 RepID=A0A6C0RGD3_9BACT|nr:RagB/SusD family nutrient uptake outer membrane protein [Draconibacterium halophilum]QIA09574.1 RagB/SusD family nutrient uptake outer membrane protein [Draconibacterium halophilum]